jgi:hypothetical protein
LQIIKAERGPLVHIHYIERSVFGNGIAIKVYGEMKIAAKEYVYAREMKLNTIETLQLTPMTGDHHLYHVQKYIPNKGEYGNYASVDIWSADGYEMLGGEGRSALISAATSLPEDGSIWLDFEAMGE